MNKEDIKRMAIEAGWDAHQSDFDTRIKTFAFLVASAEREACAKLCEKWTPTDADGVCDVADAIRERGQV